MCEKSGTLLKRAYNKNELNAIKLKYEAKHKLPYRKGLFFEVLSRSALAVSSTGIQTTSFASASASAGARASATASASANLRARS